MESGPRMDCSRRVWPVLLAGHWQHVLRHVPQHGWPHYRKYGSHDFQSYVSKSVIAERQLQRMRCYSIYLHHRSLCVWERSESPYALHRAVRAQYSAPVVEFHGVGVGISWLTGPSSPAEHTLRLRTTEPDRLHHGAHSVSRVQLCPGGHEHNELELQFGFCQTDEAA